MLKGLRAQKRTCYSANKMSRGSTHLAHHVAQAHRCCTGQAQEDKSKSELTRKVFLSVYSLRKKNAILASREVNLFEF